MSEQPRIPRGTPGGGQFGVTEKAEADVSLVPTLDGSFMYPPAFQSADEVVTFWNRVEVPDEALARTERLYREYFKDNGANWAHESWEAFGRHEFADFDPRPDEADRAALTAWETRLEAARVPYEARIQAAMGARPEKLPRQDVRTLVRAAGMMESAVFMDAENYHRVSNTPITLSTGETSIRDAVLLTGVLAFATNVTSPDEYELDPVRDEPLTKSDIRHIVQSTAKGETLTKDDIRKIVQETVQEAIHEQNKALDVALDELTDNVGLVGTTILDSMDPETIKAERRRLRRR